MALDDLISPDQQFGSLWWIAETVIRVTWRQAGEFDMKRFCHPGLCAHEGTTRRTGEAVNVLFGGSARRSDAFRVAGLDRHNSDRLTYFRLTLRPLPPQLFGPEEKEAVWQRRHPPHRLDERQRRNLRIWLRGQLPPPPRN